MSVSLCAAGSRYPSTITSWLKGVQHVGVRRLAQHCVKNAEPLGSHADREVDVCGVVGDFGERVLVDEGTARRAVVHRHRLDDPASHVHRETAQHEQVVVGHQDVDGGRARRRREKAAYDGERAGRNAASSAGQPLATRRDRRQPFGHAGGLSAVSVEAHPAHCPKIAKWPTSTWKPRSAASRSTTPATTSGATSVTAPQARHTRWTWSESVATWYVGAPCPRCAWVTSPSSSSRSSVRATVAGLSQV